MMEIDKASESDKPGKESSEMSKEIVWLSQLKDYFKLVEEDGKNVIVMCLRCLPKKKTLSTSRLSPANLLKHIEVSVL